MSDGKLFAVCAFVGLSFIPVTWLLVSFAKPPLDYYARRWEQYWAIEECRP